MDRVLWILLVVALVAVFLVLVTGVTIFARGGEANRRYGNFMMNLRVGTQAVAVLILGAILLVHWLKSSSQ
jgi:cytochrome b subunit of formate dehydrogenase